MTLWRPTALGIALILVGASTASAQQRRQQPPPEMQAPAAPPADRELSRSRFSDTKVASKPPPIVSKPSGSPKENRGAAGVSSKRLAEEEAPPETLKLKPGFATVDPRNVSELLQPTTIIAIVGGHHIIAGDLLGDVNLSIPPEAKIQLPPDEYENLQSNYLRMVLSGSLDTKLLHCDFLRQERGKEMYAKIESQISTKFDEQVYDAFNKIIAADTPESRDDLKRIDTAIRRIADLMIRENLSTMGEVDVALAKYGTSLTKERKRYAERLSAYFVLQGLTKGKGPKEVTREQQLEYYQAHLPDFDRTPRCKWEKLSVKHSRFRDEDEAWNAIAEMGNRVYLGNVKLSTVAKKSSQTSDATDGGFHDWTGKDALRSEVINDAIFELPVGQLSDILRDDEGFHIVRVIEREDGGYQPFSDPKTQELIKKRLEDEQTTQLRVAHVAKLRREIAVWNIFDELSEE